MLNNKTDINIELMSRMLSTAERLEKAGDQLFSGYGLTIKTCNILLQISNGSNTTSELAQNMKSTLPGVTQKTKVLEERGFIKRSVDAKDKRVWYFSLTKKGEEALRDALPLYEESLSLLCANFSKTEKRQTLEMLKDMEGHLGNVLENNLISKFKKERKKGGE